MITIPYTENYDDNHYKAYYVVGLVIVIFIAAYWFIFISEVELTEQRCLDTFSLYEPTIRDVVLMYEDGTAKYRTENVVATFTFSEKFTGCVMNIYDNRVIKGELVSCDNGVNSYIYAEEHANYYEIERSTEKSTTLELLEKSDEMRRRFEFAKNKNICGVAIE